MSPSLKSFSPSSSAQKASALGTGDQDGDLDSTPLLIAGPARLKATPLPLAQLLILAVIRLAEPISFTQTFPYINQMIDDLGIAEPADVGYYSGLVDSSFALVQVFAIYLWSSLSDRIGRKPVIMIGVTGAAMSSLSFGVSRSIPTLLLSRCIAGALSGNIAVVSSMISEMTDYTNQGKAFPLLGATWYIGSIIGPVIGGNLSNPVKKWPKLGVNFPIFQRYPYLLPCVISSGFSIFAVIMCAIFVQETLPSIVAKKRSIVDAAKMGNSSTSDVASYGATSSSGARITAEIIPRPSGSTTPTLIDSDSHLEFDAPVQDKRHMIIQLLSKPHVLYLLASGFMFHFLGISAEVVFVLYSYTSVELGGMGRSPEQIGYALAGSGALGTILSLVLFPYLQQRFNNRGIYIFFSACWVLAFALMPVGHFTAAIPGSSDTAKHRRDVFVWLAIALIMVPMRISVIAHLLGMVLVKASVPSPDQLGSLFGLQQGFFFLARGIAPASASALYAFSTDHQVLGGYFVWLVLLGLSIIAIPISMGIMDAPAPMQMQMLGAKSRSGKARYSS